MNQLDDDAILCILSFINGKDMVIVSSVCKKFRYLIQTNFNLKSKIICVSKKMINDLIFEHMTRGWNGLRTEWLSKCQMLTAVNFTHCGLLTDKSVVWLSTCPMLQCC